MSKEEHHSRSNKIIEILNEREYINVSDLERSVSIPQSTIHHARQGKRYITSWYLDAIEKVLVEKYNVEL